MVLRATKRGSGSEAADGHSNVPKSPHAKPDESLPRPAVEDDGCRVPPAELYPFRSHYLDLGDVRMHYVDEGDGPTVLMLHGNPTWSFYFRDLIKGLRDRYRVIVPDHIGCGLSQKPQVYPYTLSTHIDNVGRLIERLGLDDLTLAVHDWGGPIGFGWAVKNAHRVRRFVVFNTAVFVGGRLPLRIRVCRWPIIGNIAVRRLNAFALAAIYLACARQERMTAEVRRGYLLPYNSRANRIAIHRFIRDIPLGRGDPSHPVLSQIQLGLDRFRDRPMAIFWGMKDFCFTPRYLNEWVARFPRATVDRIAEAGHYVVEDAHERILPAMLDFLAES